MKIERVELQPYRLPLVAPVSGIGSLREGIALCLRSGAAAGWGDAAPLPGFSSERLADANADLQGAIGIFRGLDIPDPPASLNHLLNVVPAGLGPAATFACESALLQFVAGAGGDPPAARISAGSRATVALCALVAGGTAEEKRRGAADAAARGYRTVKIKVGGAPVERDAGTVRAIASACGDAVRLRLDANRAWRFEEAAQFGRAVADLPIEFLEEPLKDPGELERLARETGLPLALDETLRELSVEGAQALPGVAAWVIKPTLVGGVRATLRLAQAARDRGAEPVISAAFESAIGMRMLIELAAAVMTPGVAAGLDTGRWFAADLIPGLDALMGPEVALKAVRALPWTIQAPA